MTRHALWLLTVLLPTMAVANEQALINVYLEYEKAYLANDARAVGKWMARDVMIVQTLHPPGMEPSSITVSREQLLRGMRQARGPRSDDLLTSPERVSLDERGESSFCGVGGADGEVMVSGKRYSEREVRRFCFREERRGFVLYRQTIDVYYEALDVS